MCEPIIWVLTVVFADFSWFCNIISSSSQGMANRKNWQDIGYWQEWCIGHWDWFGIPSYAVMLNHSCFSDTNPEKGIISLSNSYHYKRLIDIVQNYKNVLAMSYSSLQHHPHYSWRQSKCWFFSANFVSSTEHGLLIHTSHLPGLKDTLLQPMHHKLSF